MNMVRSLNVPIFSVNAEIRRIFTSLTYLPFVKCLALIEGHMEHQENTFVVKIVQNF